MSYSLVKYHSLKEQAAAGGARYEKEHKYGGNPSVPNGSWATINQLGTMYFPTVASTVRIKAGGNTNDTALGSGATSVTVYGLDETGELAQETLATAGASASASTTTTFIRLFRVRATTVGTYATTTGNVGANAGTIVIEITAGGQDWLEVAAGSGSTEYAGYTIPLGWDGYLRRIDMQVNATKAASIRMVQRQNILTVAGGMSPKTIQFNFEGVMGGLTTTNTSPVGYLPPLTDVWMEAKGGGNSTTATASFDMELFKL